jgi:hypothetical protein
MNNNRSDRHAELIAAIDAHGVDLGRWPDAMLANRAREAALADRDLRAYLDGGKALARGLAAARDAADVGVRASGAIDRVNAAVIARSRARPHRSRWVAAAAVIVLAAGIGGILDARLMAVSGQQTTDVVALDPLILDTDVE